MDDILLRLAEIDEKLSLHLDIFSSIANLLLFAFSFSIGFLCIACIFDDVR